MTVLTECELREMLKNGSGNLPIFPVGTRFSSSAQDFINSHQIEIKFSFESGLDHSQHRSSKTTPSPEWDKPGVFPVVLTGVIPVCNECGQPIFKKPEHLTQLDAQHFAPKTNPRIIFRGRLDSLHALVLLTSSIARRFELLLLSQHLDTLGAYCREIMSSEYNLRPVADLFMMGKNADELHNISQWPDKTIGFAHLSPGTNDDEILHWLNVVRTQCREVELVAIQAFPELEHDVASIGTGIVQALNRLSSAVYVLELYFCAGAFGLKGSK